MGHMLGLTVDYCSLMLWDKEDPTIILLDWQGGFSKGNWRPQLVKLPEYRPLVNARRSSHFMF